MNSSDQHPTVSKIISAAVPLFATKGFSAVSVKEIAEAAGVNIALISYYFGGKEKLYTYVLEQKSVFVEHLIEEINEKASDPVEKIKLFMQQAVHTNKNNSYMGQIINTEQNSSAQTSGILQKIGAEIQGFLRQCILEAVAQGKFRSDLHPVYASMAIGGIMHVFFSHRDKCLTMTEEEGEAYIKQGINLFFYGVTERDK